MSPDQVRVIFERVAYRMVLAGWLKGYRFTAGIGHELIWRTEGAQNALLLKDLSEKYRLTDDDQSPLYFQMACKGMSLPDGISFPVIDIEVSEFWQLCVGELGLEGDNDGLLAMVHIVTSWGPESDASTRADG
ncbi:MAG: hypothetical protein ABIS50_20250 [Luteolibacter sp.]|uniref:hypothetical protein n=1 Tax=Luteolibacter sp. TaxID=1962973 RepID=UPI0032666053